MDKIVGQTEDGLPILQDSTGQKYVIERKKSKEINSKEIQEAEKNMADDSVTKFDLLKKDVETFNEQTKNKLAEREKENVELGLKVQELDKKVCVGEECNQRIEKTQTEQFKEFMDRLKALEEPAYLCPECGKGIIRRGMKTCPFCDGDIKW